MKTNNEYNRRKFEFKHEFSVNSNTIRAIFLRGIRKMHHHLNFIRHMSGIIYKSRWSRERYLDRIYQKGIHIGFSISQRLGCIENVSDTYDTLFESIRVRRSPRHGRVSNKYRLKYISCRILWSWYIRAIWRMNFYLFFVLFGYFFAWSSGMLYRRDSDNVLKPGEICFFSSNK